MNNRFEYYLNEKKFAIFSNSLYTSNILRRELMKSEYVECLENETKNIDGIIEVQNFQSSFGNFTFKDQSIVGESIIGNSKIIKLSNVNCIQPARIFLNSIVAQKHADILIPLHASTYYIGEKGIAICGSKNSGKSTLTLANVLWNQALFVADDITFLSCKGFNTFASGLFKGMHVTSSEMQYFKYKYRSAEHLKKMDEFKERIVFKSSNTIEYAPLNYILFTKIIKNKKNHFKIEKITNEKEKLRLLIENTVNFNFSLVEKQMKTIERIIESTISFYHVELGTDVDNSLEKINRFFSKGY